MEFHIEPSALSTHERARLDECERSIDRLRHAFVDAGLALREIRDARLYREHYPTFDAYTLNVHHIRRNYADKLIAAAEAAQLVGTIVPELPAPGTIAHARELAELAENQVALGICWRVVHEVSKRTGGDITARIVRSTIDTIANMTITGAIDGGDGNDIPVSDIPIAAITEDAYERLQRQQAILAEKRKPALVNAQFEVDQFGYIVIPDLQAYVGKQVRVIIYEGNNGEKISIRSSIPDNGETVIESREFGDAGL